jgi:hypothetical protein
MRDETALVILKALDTLLMRGSSYYDVELRKNIGQEIKIIERKITNK